MLNIIQNDLIRYRYDGRSQGYFKEEEPLYPSIGQNVIEVPVDLSWSSLLRFRLPSIDQNTLILWQLELALEKAPLSLRDEGQFSAQARAVQEFNKQLFDPLQKKTFGISLYKGPLASAERETLLDYCKLLTAYLPEGVPLFLMFDGKELSEAEFLMLTSKEQFFPFHLILAHPLLQKIPYSLDVIGWGQSTVMGKAYSMDPQYPSKRLSNGFLLPHSSCNAVMWEEVVTHLEEIQRKEMRLIPESLLTEMWEGIDDLYFIERAITPQGRRKLAGFAAAGGLLHPY